MGDITYPVAFLEVPGKDASAEGLRRFSRLLSRRLPVTVWDFGVPGKPPYGKLRLMPSGKIADYSHPNERFWRLTDRGLEFLNDGGEITTIFSDCTERPDGRLVLIGQFVGSPDGPVHYLTCVQDGAETIRCLQPRGASPLWFDRQNWRIDVVRPAGLGDALMTAAALRTYKRLYPDVEVNFYTDYYNLFISMPYIDKSLPAHNFPTLSTLIKYEHLMPSPHHVARLIGYLLGLDNVDVRPDCPVDLDLVATHMRDWHGMPRPWVVAQRRSNRHYTPNKDWPEDYWLDLISSICGMGSVIDIGHEGEGGPSLNHPSYRDLRGKTSIKEMIAAIAAADIYVGPPSGPLHVAAAFGKPIVNIIGGYELPSNTEYDRTIAFGADIPCAPCALTKPCSFGGACLWRIAPERVFAAVQEHWRGCVLGSHQKMDLDCESASDHAPRPIRSNDLRER
jgi:hypothetical protein